jgi:hypothetical protein
LPKSDLRPTVFYELVRSVRNGVRNFEVQLYSTPSSVEDNQEIIVLINQQGQVYAIPFFSNKYRDYWNFQFDRQIPEKEKIVTTFET